MPFDSSEHRAQFLASLQARMPKPDDVIEREADGKFVWIMPLLGGRARVCVGEDWTAYADGW